MTDPGGHQHHVDPGELVSVEDHRRAVLSAITPLEPIELNLFEAHGCVLVADVIADADIPSFTRSAMDGYAVLAETAGPGATLRVTGEVAAGTRDPVRVRPGEAVRIMTGAPIPAGADAVVPVEVADERDGKMQVRATPMVGDHIRPAGEDVRAGTTVLRSGRRLGAADIGMLASVGRGRALVHPRPRVAVISTGDELTEPEATLAPGQIRDTNSYTLTAMAQEAGATAFRHTIVRDDRRALIEAFEGALSHADMLVTSGGVSAGRYDLVKQVLAQLGDVRSTKVGMQPGMPQAFGFVTRPLSHPVPCFGLPGNPVSAFVSFEVFVRPALRRLQGRTDLNRPRINAVLDEPLRSPQHRVSFIRVTLRRDDDAWHARATGPQGSGILTSAVEADGLAEVPSDRTEVPAGETVVVHLLVSQ
jgi:molybdopterin molybdotransferase